MQVSGYISVMQDPLTSVQLASAGLGCQRRLGYVFLQANAVFVWLLHRAVQKSSKETIRALCYLVLIDMIIVLLKTDYLARHLRLIRYECFATASRNKPPRVNIHFQLDSGWFWFVRRW